MKHKQLIQPTPKNGAADGDRWARHRSRNKREQNHEGHGEPLNSNPWQDAEESKMAPTPDAGRYRDARRGLLIFTPLREWGLILLVLGPIFILVGLVGFKKNEGKK